MGLSDIIRKRPSLPKWAKYASDGAILVNRDSAYPLYLSKLAPVLPEAAAPTQFALEVARRCFTEDLFQRVGPGLHIRLVSENKERWRLTNYPPGPGAEAGAAAFRGYYRMIC